MSPHLVVTLDDAGSSTTVTREESCETENQPPRETSPARGRILYCRKCEGHGEKVILKNHAPSCPYILCTCKSCERLNTKRLKSFNKRNKEKLELAAALSEKRRKELEEAEDQSRKVSSCSTSSCQTDSSLSMDSESSSSSTRTGLEGRSMSLGAMTVMSYDIWKAKCAAEKKRLEAEGKLPESEKEKEFTPIRRKRAHTFVAKEESKDIPKVSPPNVGEKRGRYILLPTIPAMRVFVDEANQPISEPTALSAPSAPQPHHSPMAAPVPAPMPSLANFVSSTPASSLPLAGLSSISPIMTPALSMAPPLPRPHPISFQAPVPTTTTSSSLFSPEQLLNLLPPSMLLQSTLLQQQNTALQQLLGLIPISQPPTSTSDVLSALLRAQHLPPMPVSFPQHPTPNKPSVSDELLQSLLAQSRQQPIFSNTI